MYHVFYTTSASRHLKRLPHDVLSAVKVAVEALVSNPRTFHTEKLEGAPNAYRLRVGRYRILYTIEDSVRRVVIYRIAHRRDVYR